MGNSRNGWSYVADHCWYPILGGDGGPQAGFPVERAEEIADLRGARGAARGVTGEPEPHQGQARDADDVLADVG